MPTLYFHYEFGQAQLKTLPKSEQNIINTFDYSNKKIKRIKSIFIVIITFIIILLVTLFILFNIDMHRMRNNKPVLFSTWGYEYAPPLNLKEIEIYQAIKNYMVEKLDAEISYYEGKKSFVSFRSYLLEEEKKDSTYNVYAWVMYGRYYEENNELKQDAASSAPYKFHVENINDEFKTISSRTPRDGSYYKEDMENIFPKSVREDFNDCEIDGTIDKLTMEIEDQAKLYFHLK